MKNKLLFLSVLSLMFIPAGLFLSCASAPSGSASGPLSAKTLALVKDAVFEVVLEKPAEGRTVYEKDLNWDKVPYAIRNDKYYSIGTAFAISKTELITAFHVIDLGMESEILDKYYIRDSGGKVYEVDKVTGGSNEKDYLILTVKGKTFGSFFQFERNYKTGDPVFSIGNALGEGIVVRNGLILGTVPEEDSGRWNLLKSSADGNPGNSGGPLVTQGGKVVGLVNSLKDNILYSIPSDVILDDSRSSLSYREKTTFGHLLLANKINYTIETNVPLPDTYTAIRSSILETYKKDYDAAMTELFNEAPEYLTGPNNAYLLNSALSSPFPEISFVDPNDDNWKLSSFDRKISALDDDGRLMYASVSGYNFYKIKRPLSVPIEKINTDPKFIMDLILQNLRAERTLWGSDKYRILSFGDPSSTGQFRDPLGRTWLTAYWNLDFDDKVLIMYILPLPNGPAIVSTIQPGAFQFDYDWDIKKICEHTFVAYDAYFSEWVDFLTIKKFTPDFLSDMSFNWSADDKSVVFNCGPFSINANKQVLDWANDSDLFLAPTWYKQNNKLEFDIRKIIINRDLRGKDFVVLYRNIKPDPKLGSDAMEGWNDLVKEKYPFDGNPVISAKDNTGSIGAIIKAGQDDPEAVFTLYMSMENPVSEKSLGQRFDALKQQITISQ